ncbi:MAG TPA: type II toxin-antitoxin system HicB family antitoxin [Chloroflexota bacterium]|nr:type II toxin-antitoxin system HicB family antitoxin [Chloroflexota bacterium]
MNQAPHYSIVIAWSDEDQAYVVSLPEWADYYAMPVASGATYEEAALRGRNALENYIRFALEDGRPLPRPRVFVGA